MTAFQGKRTREICRVVGDSGDHDHALTVASYQFPDGSVGIYVEVDEPGRSDRRRVIALSTAVHALLNLGEVEIFQVGNRESIPEKDPDLQAGSRGLSVDEVISTYFRRNE